MTLIVVGIVAALPWLTRQPKQDASWAVGHARASRANRTGRWLYLDQVRDFRYAADGRALVGYHPYTYNLDSLESAWFVVTTFSKQWRAPAHTFVSFGFKDGTYLAVSVEARRERHEGYGIFAGLLRNYELIYVYGEERDLIGRRAAVEGDATWLYPVRAPRENIRAMLVAMVERSNQLLERPEFYNSLLNSCTSNLVRHVNQIAPGRIPAGWKVLVPGYTDDVALGLGLIATTDSLEAARARYRINDKARRAIALDGPAFSRAIRTD